MDGVEPDDERYPDVPVPPHERAWRHPSEVGEAKWQRTEPPLTVGRGLLVTTGAIGGLLALAVLWAMLPTASGGGNAVSTEAARPPRSAFNSVRSTDSRTGPPAILAATTVAPATTPTTVRPPTSAVTAAPTARASAAEDTDTIDTSDDPTTSTPSTEPGHGSTTVGAATVPQATISLSGGNGPSMAIAVAVGGVPIVLTTVSAVGDIDDTVMLAFDDGSSAEATVALKVDGIAVLTTDDAAAAATTFKLAGTPHDGDQVTLLGPSPATVALHIGGDGTLQLQSWGDGDVAEGTPVVNDQGRVVALCSKGSAGPTLVTIDQRTLRAAVASATAGSTSTTHPERPYLGVYLNADPTGSLTINAVDPNGPAAAAGIVAGDTIVSIDYRALATSDDLYEALGEHVADDDVAVTVRRTDGSEATVDVVLVVAPARA